jgi:hypothetical protein
VTFLKHPEEKAEAKFFGQIFSNVKPGDPQPGPSREKRQKREN